MFTGHWEWLIILLVILLLFGSKRLPDLARSLGKSLNEFKRGKEEIAREMREAMDEDEDAKQVEGASSEVSSADSAKKSESETVS